MSSRPAGRAELVGPDRAGDETLLVAVHRVIAAVVALGGAVGFLAVPGREQTDAWVTAVLTDAAAGNGALAVAEQQGRLAALGAWRRSPHPPMRVVAGIEKVMVDPAARGAGLSTAVVSALLDDAGAHRVEVARLGVRGNNHAAVALYRSLGFRVLGVLPNAIAVDDARFDGVEMVRELVRPPGLTLLGSRPQGPGASTLRPAPRPGSGSARQAGGPPRARPMVEPGAQG